MFFVSRDHAVNSMLDKAATNREICMLDYTIYFIQFS